MRTSIMGLLFLGVIAHFIQATSHQGYAVKAVFLLRFTRRHSPKGHFGKF